jgi:hypothetical protein
MFIYWILFIVPTALGLATGRLTNNARLISLLCASLILVIFIGLREHIGHDWNNYLAIYERTAAFDFVELFTGWDVGFSLINWVAAKTGLGFYGMNFICAAIFTAGLVTFANRQPNFWRTMALAVPVLIIIVSMSATRQATAIGVLGFAFLAFIDRRPILYAALVVLAATFHKSAAVMILLLLFQFRLDSLWRLAAAAAGVVLAGWFFLFDAIVVYSASYMDSELQANGALPRAGLNVVAAIAFFVLRKQWRANYDDYPAFFAFAVTMLATAPIVFIQPVVGDRLAMYLLLPQIAILARLPQLLPRQTALMASVGIYLVFATVMGVWLNFSFFAQVSWIPYENFLWVDEARRQAG